MIDAREPRATALLSASLNNAVALVTGAGSGIGRAAALRLAGAGAAVAVIDLRRAAADAVAAEIADRGGRALAVPADVASEADVERSIAAVTDHLGDITVLFTAAGIGASSAPTHDTPLDQWQRVIDINLTGTFLFIKHVIPGMLRTGAGSIITCGAASALASPTGADPAYRASKGGILSLTRTVAVEYAAQGIRANCVCPGPITTEFWDNTASIVHTTVRVPRSTGRPTNPMERRGSVDEIASVVLFLACDQSSFMTGATVPVDGGYSIS